MGLHPEDDPTKSGEYGEWAGIECADDIAQWRSWRKKAIVIGPVAVAYEGMWPEGEFKIEFDEPLLVICRAIHTQRSWLGGRIVEGVTVDYPLVLDDQLEALREIISEDGDPLTHIWVDNDNADHIRAYKGKLPYIDLSDRIQDIPTERASTG